MLTPIERRNLRRAAERARIAGEVADATTSERDALMRDIHARGRASQAELARLVGLTRQRAGQILKGDAR